MTVSVESQIEYPAHSAIHVPHEICWYLADPVDQIRPVKGDQRSGVDDGITRQPGRYRRQEDVARHGNHDGAGQAAGAVGLLPELKWTRSHRRVDGRHRVRR